MSFSAHGVESNDVNATRQPVPAKKPARGAIRRFAWAVISQAGRIPLAGALVSAAYRSYFNSANGSHVRLFRGTFPDFDAARRAIPASRIESYDNEPSAQRMIGEWLNIDASDYPVMFWLARVLPTARLVFDWGGNVGLKYFAYRTYLEYEPELTWLVNDVPAVVALGERVAQTEGASALRFTTTLDALPDADVLLAAGALQFIDDPLARLAAARGLPRHVIVSKIPAYAAAGAVTLHNMGTALCPYHLFNRSAFVAALERLGFELVDEWASPNVGCEIPFHPDRSVAAYTGFYFRRRT